MTRRDQATKIKALAVTAASYFDGLARERMTAALVALARHAGCLEAGMVPPAVPVAA